MKSNGGTIATKSACLEVDWQKFAVGLVPILPLSSVVPVVNILIHT